VVFEYVIAGNLGRFLAVVGAVLERAGFVGAVDLGVAITGIQGAISSTNYETRWFDRRYPQESFANTTRVLAVELASDPSAIAIQLLRTFLDRVANMHLEPLIRTSPPT
jgi:hypothetical protein